MFNLKLEGKVSHAQNTSTFPLIGKKTSMNFLTMKIICILI